MATLDAVDTVRVHVEPKVEPEVAEAAEGSEPASEFTRSSLKVLFGSFMVHLALLGIVYSIGVLLTAYTQALPYTINELAWIGTIQAGSLPGLGIPSGMLADRIGYKPAMIIGALLVILGLFLASFCSELWLLYLTHGVMVGAGLSISYFPAISICTHWFDKERGFSTGIAASGSGIGGFAVAIITQYWIDTMNFRAALRYQALVLGTIMLLCILIMEEKHADEPTTEQGKKQEEQQEAVELQEKQEQANDEEEVQLMETQGEEEVKEATPPQDTSLPADVKVKVGLLMATNFLVSFGYFVPFIFMGPYIVHLGYSAQFAALSIGAMNMGTAVSRVTMGRVADKIGFTLSMSLCIGSSAVVIAIWSICTDQWSIVLICACYGLAVGSYISLAPAYIATIVPRKRMASVLGLVWSTASFGNLLGSPVMALVLTATSYSTMILVDSSLMFAGILTSVWLYKYDENGKKPVAA